MFDTYATIQQLKAAGFTEAQAVAQVNVVREAMAQGLATKQDLKDLRQEIKDGDAALRTEIKAVETALRAEIKDLEHRLVLKMGAMWIGAVGVLAVLMKVL